MNTTDMWICESEVTGCGGCFHICMHLVFSRSYYRSHSCYSVASVIVCNVMYCG